MSFVCLCVCVLLLMCIIMCQSDNPMKHISVMCKCPLGENARWQYVLMLDCFGGTNFNVATYWRMTHWKRFHKAPELCYQRPWSKYRVKCCPTNFSSFLFEDTQLRNILNENKKGERKRFLLHQDNTWYVYYFIISPTTHSLIISFFFVLKHYVINLPF